MRENSWNARCRRVALYIIWRRLFKIYRPICLRTISDAYSTQCQTVLRHVLQQTVVRRVIEITQFMSNCTYCISLTVLILGSRESLNCIIMCIKFYSNSMFPSWCTISIVPQCIFFSVYTKNKGPITAGKPPPINFHTNFRILKLLFQTEFLA